MKRVVVTGMGVVAPNGNGVGEFELALRKGQSGIRTNEQMIEAGFASQVAGVPQGVDEIAASMFDEELLRAMNMSHRYVAIAAVDAWKDAGLHLPALDQEAPDWDSGAVLGTGQPPLGMGRSDPVASAGKLGVVLEQSVDGRAGAGHAGDQRAFAGQRVVHGDDLRCQPLRRCGEIIAGAVEPGDQFGGSDKTLGRDRRTGRFCSLRGWQTDAERDRSLPPGASRGDI